MKKKFKTRFPMARIKKIMQSDEEVGKIALATPILISRTLELFLKDLITKTSEYTRAKNGKLVRKQCVAETEQFDFLKEIVEAASEAPRARKGRGADQQQQQQQQGDEGEGEGDGDGDDGGDEEEDEDDEEEEDDERPPAKRQRPRSAAAPTPAPAAPPRAPAPAPAPPASAAGVVSVRSLLNSSDGHS